jgi:Icc-related predicted phosphoesterase
VRLFRRQAAAEDPEFLRLYYASDIHGTEVLWKKFLNAPKAYKAKVLVMGGDITGKMVIPILEQGDGTWSATFHGRKQKLATEADIVKLESNSSGGFAATACTRTGRRATRSTGSRRSTRRSASDGSSR